MAISSAVLVLVFILATFKKHRFFVATKLRRYTVKDVLYSLLHVYNYMEMPFKIIYRLMLYKLYSLMLEG